MKKILRNDFIRFCLVGTLGFIINFILLTVLYKKIGIRLFFSQLFAAEVALFSNFLFHHHWTYKGHNVAKSITQLLIQFHASSWVAIIGSAILVSVGVHVLHLNYGLALVVSSIVALGWNYGWSKFGIWQHKHQSVPRASDLPAGSPK